MYLVIYTSKVLGAKCTQSVQLMCTFQCKLELVTKMTQSIFKC